MANIFVPKEIVAEESRVAVVPDTVRRLVKRGFSVCVERDAGVGAFFDSLAYEQAGATLVDGASGWGAADVVLKLHPPSLDEAASLKSGAVLISLLWPHQNLEVVARLARGNVSAFAMDLVPRISRAQTMDALSSQSNLAGYKAVLLAADRLPKIFPLMTTAAGTIAPAKVVVLGGGVAGLQAVATAKRLGAVVEVSDVRLAVKEQVESLGARFISVEGAESLEGAGGYAKEASPEFLRRQQELVRAHLVAADAIITTALVPGKPAPRLIAADVVREMRPGSVIVDMAVEQGGNCELSEAGKISVKHGVTLIGLRNLPGLIPAPASQVYSRNVLAVVEHLFAAAGAIDLTDEINGAAFVTHQGVVRLSSVRGQLEGKG